MDNLPRGSERGMLDHFTIASFEVRYQAVDPLHLPVYKGSTLRGGFGHAFRRVVCTMRGKSCPDCLLQQQCVYSYVFHTPPSQGASMLLRSPAAPHPFVIEPPLETKREYGPGDEVTFKLILIGRAIDYLPYFIYTFERMGEIGIGRGKGKLQLMEVRDGLDSGQQIYSGEKKTLVNDYTVLQGLNGIGRRDEYDSEMTLNFLSPTRIKYGQKYISKVEFHILIRNLLRRISLLYEFHCGGQVDFDYKEIIAEAAEITVKDSNLYWYDWTRYSNLQETRMKLGGFRGVVRFEGEFNSFIPFLQLGELIHIGKGSTFGLGKYEIKN